MIEVSAYNYCQRKGLDDAAAFIVEIPDHVDPSFRDVDPPVFLIFSGYAVG